MIEGLILVAELTLMFLLLRSVRRHSRDEQSAAPAFFAYLDKKPK